MAPGRVQQQHQAAAAAKRSTLGGSAAGREQVKGVKEMLDEGLNEVPKDYVCTPELRPSAEPLCTEQAIPVLDLAGIAHAGVEDPEKRAQLVKQIGEACEEWGFFQVLNHGVDIQRIKAAVRKFYELPASEKKIYPSHSADAGVTFTTGYRGGSGKAQDWKDALIIRRRPGVCDGFKEAPVVIREEVQEYASTLERLARWLYDAIFESLGLDAHTVEVSGRPLPGIERLVLTINFYPPCPDPSLTYGLSAHSDISSFTILLSDEIAGLQVRKGDKWVPVDPIANAFIINLADQIEILTNARYKSVEHRVITNTTLPRTSLAANFGPSEDTKIAPHPCLIDDEHPAIFREITFGEYLYNYYTTDLPLYKATLNFAGASYDKPGKA